MSDNLLTLVQLRDQFLACLDEAGDTGTTKTVADQFLNTAHRRRLTQANWPFLLWPVVQTITTAAGTQDYVLHEQFHKPFYFWNATQTRYLSFPPTRTWPQFNPRPTDSSSLLRAQLGARQPVLAQPPTAGSTLSMVSSAAGDGAGEVLRVRGVTAAGVVTEALTANGVTPVVSSNTFTAIINASKEGTWAGTMTLTYPTGGATALVLTTSEQAKSYQTLHLIDLPNAAETIRYEFYRLPSPLTNDSDVPDIPPPFQELIVYDALLLMAGYNTDLASKSISVWTDLRDSLDTQLRQAYLEPQGVNSEPKFVNYLGDPDLPLGPRVA